MRGTGGREERKRGNGRKTLRERGGEMAEEGGRKKEGTWGRGRKKAEWGRYLEGGNRQEEKQKEREGRGRT